MPTYHLHLKNVPPQAGTLDIRRLFCQFDIPDGGVQIVGGPEGNTFVTFSNNDDLLKAALYDKHYLLGSQVVVTLVSGNDIKHIVEKVKHELPLRRMPMDLAPVHQPSQSRGPSASWGSAAQAFPPLRMPSYSLEGPMEQRHKRAATPPRLPDTSEYAGVEPKRIRLSNQPPYKGNDWAASSEDKDSTAIDENLAMELEMEIKDAQEIVDLLKKKKERIKNLKQTIIEKGIVDTMAKKNPAGDETWAPQITGSGIERKQPNLHAVKQDKYQYQTGQMMQPNLYHMHPGKHTTPPIYQRDDAEKHQTSRPTENTWSDRKAWSGPRSGPPTGQCGGKNKGYSTDLPRYPGPREDNERSGYPGPCNNFEDQRYSGQNEEYSHENPRYPGPNENYEHLRHSDKNEGHYHEKSKWLGRSENYEDTVFRHQNEGYNYENPRYPSINQSINTRYPAPSENYVDPRYAGRDDQSINPPGHDENWKDPRYRGQDDRYNCEEPRYPGPREKYENQRYPQPGKNHQDPRYPGANENSEDPRYLRPCVNYGDQQHLGPSENYVRPVYGIQNEGYNNEDLRYPRLSPYREDQRPMKNRNWGKKSQRGRDLNEYKGAPDLHGGSGNKRTDNLKFAGMATPEIGIHPVLFFIGLNTLSEDETASSVWKKFGGPHGHSVGVLLLDRKGDRSERIAFVAYKSQEVSKTEVKHYAGSWLSSAKAVYGNFAKALPGSKMYKTTTTGEDVELSDNEKALFGPKIILNVSGEFPPVKVGKEERDNQQHILNVISRSLFDLKSTDESQDGCFPDTNQVCYLFLPDLPMDTTACQVWSWFGGATGPCFNVVVTEGKKRKLAYVAFKDSESRNAGRAKYTNSKPMGIRTAFRNIAHESSKSIVCKSTDTGTDTVLTEEQKLAFQKEWFPQGRLIHAECPHVLQVSGICNHDSACKVWSWFGGDTGPSQGVTLMGDGATNIAFVRFTDAVKCNQEQMKHQPSEVITGTEMLKRLSSCPVENIMKSSVIGDCPMGAVEWNSLVERFCPEKKPATSQMKKQAKISHHTSVGHTSSGPVKEPKGVCRPDTKSNRPTLHFLALRALPKGTTSNSVWKQFGGSSGRSLGVLLLQLKKQERIAFVAYEHSDDRKTDMHLHAGAVAWSIVSVYTHLANAPSGSPMYKTTADGCVNISKSERDVFQLLIDPTEFAQFRSKEKMEHQWLIVDRISRTLFDKRSAGEELAKTPSCYLRLTDMPPETTASEVWSWYGGAAGPCPPVIMTRSSTSQPDGGKVAYVTFKDRESFDAGKTKSSRHQTLTKKGMLHCIAQSCACPDTEIFKSTDTGVDEAMTEEQKLSIIKKSNLLKSMDDLQEESVVKKPDLTGTIKPALHFIAFRGLSESETPASIWEKFGGSLGPSVGTLLLDKKDERMGFVAYENVEERNAALHLHAENRAWVDRAVYTRYARGILGTKMFKTSPAGDVEISVDAKVILSQELLVKIHNKKPKSEKEKDEQQLIFNKISRTLFEMKITDENQETDLPDPEGNNSGPVQSQLCYLQLDHLPLDTTACEVRSWYSGAAGPCLHVTLTNYHHNQTNCSKVAHVAFKDYESCNAAKKKYFYSKSLSEKGALQLIAHVSAFQDTEIFKSTDAGVDEVMTKEEKLALRAKWDPEDEITDEAPYVLQILGITSDVSACKVWSWFGGQKGAAQDVTLMPDGMKKIAFVRFSDPVKCNEQQALYQFSKIITKTEMLKIFASCPCDRKIIKSSPKGDKAMSQWEQDDLRKRFSLEEKQVNN